MADPASDRPTGRPESLPRWGIPALFLAITALMAYPISLRPGSGLMGDFPDGHLFVWTLAWNTHAFVNQPLSIFDANIFYPNERTLAYSENLIGSALLAAPILWVTGNPVIAMNLVSVLTCALCGIGAYLLGRRLHLSTAGAILTGLVFAFSPARYFRISQLHVNAVQWIPFSLAFLHAYLDRGRKRDLRLAVALFSLQALASGHGAVFLLVAIAGLLVYRVALGEPLAVGRRIRDLGISGALLLAPAVLIYLPYRRVQAEMGLVRPLEYPWGATPDSFLASGSLLHHWMHSFLRDPHVNTTASAYLFPGYLPIVLAIVALWWGGRGVPAAPSRSDPRRRTAWSGLALPLEIAALVAVIVAIAVTVYGPLRLRIDATLLFTARDAGRAWLISGLLLALRIVLLRRAPLIVPGLLQSAGQGLGRWRLARAGERRTHRTFYALLLVLCVLFSLGPPFGVWNHVYWLPGFNFIRASSRFMVLAVLALAVLAGMGFDRIGRRIAARRRAVLATVVGALLLVESAGPVRFDPYQWEIPAVDRWLAGQPRRFAVAEVPVRSFERYQSMYMLHSMAHWQKTVHGYSGLRPIDHDRLYRQLEHFPDETSLRSLAQFGVDYVVVHSDYYAPGLWPAVDERLTHFSGWLRLEHVDGPGRVYSLRPPPAEYGGS